MSKRLRQRLSLISSQKVPPPPPSISNIKTTQPSAPGGHASVVARMSVAPSEHSNPTYRKRADLSPATEQALFDACAHVLSGQPVVDPDFADDLYEFREKEKARERATRLEPQRLGKPKAHVKSKFREGSVYEDRNSEHAKQLAQTLGERGRPNTVAPPPQRKTSEDSIQKESLFSKRSRSASKDRKSRPKTAGAKLSENTSLHTSKSNASSTDKAFTRSTTATSVHSESKTPERVRPKTQHDAHKSTFSTTAQSRQSKHDPFPMRIGSMLSEYMKPKPAMPQPPNATWWSGTARPGAPDGTESDSQPEPEDESSDSELELDLADNDDDDVVDMDADREDIMMPLRETLSGASSQQQQHHHNRLSLDSLSPRSPTFKRHSARLSADLSGLVRKVSTLGPREAATVIGEDGIEVTMTRREEKARDKDLARLVEEKMRRGAYEGAPPKSPQRLRSVRTTEDRSNSDDGTIAFQRAALAISSGRQPVVLGRSKSSAATMSRPNPAMSSSSIEASNISASASSSSSSTTHAPGASEKKVGGLRRQLSKLSFGLGGTSKAARIRRGEPIVEEERPCYPVRA